jgi:L-rhamnose isomerase
MRAYSSYKLATQGNRINKHRLSINSIPTKPRRQHQRIGDGNKGDKGATFMKLPSPQLNRDIPNQIDDIVVGRDRQLPQA